MILFPTQTMRVLNLQHKNTFGFYSWPVMRPTVGFYIYFRPKNNLTGAYVNTCTETLVMHYDAEFMNVFCRFVSLY